MAKRLNKLIIVIAQISEITTEARSDTGKLWRLATRTPEVPESVELMLVELIIRPLWWMG